MNRELFLCGNGYYFKKNKINDFRDCKSLFELRVRNDYKEAVITNID